MDIGDVKRLTLGPSDRLLVTVPSSTTMEDLDRIVAALKASLPDTRFVVITDQITVSVVADEEQ